ncbi:alpha/beta hydrolase [Kribbella qitaiheensis]|uniref:prolyl aminopeptidase n=1 Tax=Kribbella qitaiheensis TaxID=1544730 RepID=A0A7G6WXL4_9ACTN|nr:alpha/beta hydrolase [Kribbella qitaiheensis]QNE18729.1 alpha/beta hydrolase [Kribbella qitaiheensis]
MRLVLAVILLLTCACTGPSESKESCAGVAGFTCTTLRVPLDHHQPGGKALDLAVVVADNADAPRGVLLMLTGGPGQPGVGLLARVRTYLDPAVLREYRLVMFDQRGTGTPGINCPSLQTAVGGSDFLTPPVDAVQDCARQLGPDRDYYGTPDTVEDIELLRQSLNQERLTLDGTSYGSFTAAQYGLKYPSRVRSLVLDSVVPHGGINPFGVDLMAATGPVLAAACKRDPACTSDPVADLAWLVRHGELDGAPLNGTSLMESLSILSLNAVNPSFDGIPRVLHAARGGDTAGLNDLFQQATSRSAAYDDLSAGLHLATFCSDLRFPWGTSATPLADRPAPLESALKRLDPAYLYPFDVATARNQLMTDACLRWPPTRTSTYPADQTLLPPTLILHGSNDLFCPATWATWEQAHARNARLVLVPGSGHGVQRSPTNPTGKTETRNFLLR